MADKQKRLFEDDAKAAAKAEQEAQPRAVSDILHEWRLAWSAEFRRRRDAGELGPHIYENIRRNAELRAEREAKSNDEQTL